MIHVLVIVVLIIMIIVVVLIIMMLLFHVLIMFLLKFVTEVNVVVYSVVIDGPHRIKDIAFVIKSEINTIRAFRI